MKLTVDIKETGQDELERLGLTLLPAKANPVLGRAAVNTFRDPKNLIRFGTKSNHPELSRIRSNTLSFERLMTKKSVSNLLDFGLRHFWPLGSLQNLWL